LSGPLRLGVIPTIGPFLLPRLMPALREAFPKLRLFLREDTTERLVDRLDEGRLDLALLALPCSCGPAETLPIARDGFLAALPAGHVLAEREAVPPAALAADRLLLLEDGHCLRDQALAACGFVRGDGPRGNRTGGNRTGGDRTGDPADGFAATSLHTLVQMVAGGLGVTVLPRLAVEAGIAEGTGIVLRPLAGAGMWRTLGLAWRRNAPRAAEYRSLAPVVAQSVS
jgi:LysR family hydrogen peroxide-inducible transcriptional activator